MNLHVHIHAAAIDGVYTCDEDGSPRFHFLPPLTPADIHWVCSRVATRVCMLLRRRGLLRDHADDSAVEPLASSTALHACRKAALSQGRFERLDASYIPWAELMRRTRDIDPAHGSRGKGRLQPIAIIAREDIVEKILSHVHLPTAPEPVGPGGSLAWELDEPMQDWVVGIEPEPPDVAMTQRGPPCDACVDPPASD